MLHLNWKIWIECQINLGIHIENYSTSAQHIKINKAYKDGNNILVLVYFHTTALYQFAAFGIWNVNRMLKEKNKQMNKKKIFIESSTSLNEIKKNGTRLATNKTILIEPISWDGLGKILPKMLNIGVGVDD